MVFSACGKYPCLRQHQVRRTLPCIVHRLQCDLVSFSDYREVAMDGWTKGGIDVVCWSVPSFQHTIYPPKSPSLFSLLLLPLISFSCRCSQYYFKRLMVSADPLHQFLADCPCLVGVKAKRK